MTETGKTGSRVSRIEGVGDAETGKTDRGQRDKERGAEGGGREKTGRSNRRELVTSVEDRRSRQIDLFFSRDE